MTAMFAIVPALADGIRFVHGEAKSIHIGLPDHDGEITLVAGGCFLEDLNDATVVYRGDSNGQLIATNRFSDTGRDRLFDKFSLLDSDGEQVGSSQYVTKVEPLQSQVQTAAWPKAIKGLQCVVDFDDAATLGAAHVTVNVSITGLLEGPVDPDSAANDLTYDVDGKRYQFRASQVANLDQMVRSATSRGLNAIAILLCTKVNRSENRHTLIHPDADLSAGNVFGVNLTTAEAERQYRAIIGFLGRRYSRQDQKYGSFGGYIVGNEVQSHGIWHNMGRQAGEAVTRQYAEQLRLTYFALSNEVSNPRVFASFDHHWTSQHGDDDRKALPGREFLDQLAATIRESGDFPWHVAWHPYPEDLFDPEFWKDSQAEYSFDTPKITFKNIEVLLAYLERPELKHETKRRRVILSEQGFHAGNSAASEQVQAAAFAASYIRISAIEGIDAFILHRHVDHPREGGLKLGLWSERQGRPDRKRPIYETFRAAGTDRQDDAFRFALPIVDLDSWEEMRIRQRSVFDGPSPEH